MKNLTNIKSALKFAVIAAVFCLTFAPIHVRADEVDDYVKAQMQKLHTPGLSLAVIKNGRTVKTAGYGLANVELNVAASPETVYQSGSVGKQFTAAAAVMLLVEEGKIALDDRISKYLAESETGFFLKAIDAQITFVKDNKGQVVRLILHQGGVDMEAKKIY